MDWLFPTLDRMVRIRRWVLHRLRVRSVARRPDAIRVGWVVYGSLDQADPSFFDLAPPVSMRVRDVALAINESAPDVWNEMYRRGAKYDVVVVFKAMAREYQEEARRLQAAGTRIVFDANVNYFEDWGNFRVPATRPTPEQREQVVAMTRLADHVVADSTYLEKVAREHNAAVTRIPDNVDLDVYRPGKVHRAVDRPRLVWCGVAKKAEHLRILAGAFPEAPPFSLTLVSDHVPPILADLAPLLPCAFAPFTESRYRHELAKADIIVSPKYLDCSYEMGHTEYKVSPGMAMGLPAITSPQQSYVEVLDDGRAGIVAHDAAQWKDALRRLGSDPALRQRMGDEGRRVVRERYSTAVVAERYRALLLEVAGRQSRSST